MHKYASRLDNIKINTDINGLEKIQSRWTGCLITKSRSGDKGEKLAENFLKRKGYNIIQRNYRCKLGEIDIIAELDDVIVFVEVRTKRTESFGIPQYSITSSKIGKITKNCS